MKSKKIIIMGTIVIIVIILLIALGVIINNKNTKEDNSTDKNYIAEETTEMYQKISETKQIAYTFTLDDNNKETIYIKDEKAYKEVTTNGTTYKYIVKEGNTYYLDEESKIYYEYKNNTSILTELKSKLEKLQDASAITGKEKINGKTYSYEEFEEYQEFLMNSKIAVTDITKAKTRIYYENGKIVYIKTIAGDNEEILKVDISYNNINSDYFNIPDEYQNGI